MNLPSTNNLIPINTKLDIKFEVHVQISYFIGQTDVQCTRTCPPYVAWRLSPESVARNQNVTLATSMVHSLVLEPSLETELVRKTPMHSRVFVQRNNYKTSVLIFCCKVEFSLDEVYDTNSWLFTFPLNCIQWVFLFFLFINLFAECLFTNS